MPSLRPRLTAVEVALDDMSDALDRQIADALTDIDNLIAADAAANHTFTNRTGDLEASIQSRPQRGTWINGTLSGGVDAGESYGSYLEEGTGDGYHAFTSQIDNDSVDYGPWAFLTPAMLRQDNVIDGRLETALIQATNDAGWGR